MGQVYIVQKINYDKMSFVLKQIYLEEGFEEFMQREYDILRLMDHPFITTIVEAYYNEQAQVLSLVSPLYEGGEVMDQIEAEAAEDRTMDERTVARTVFQLLLALNYMHMRGVCHRDLKPQNVMYEQRKFGFKNSFIRLIDFGFAVSLSQWQPAEGVSVGTLEYIAPEILLEKPLTLKSDMWALGVITYQMCVGYTPFFNHKRARVLELIKTCDFDYNAQDWSFYSKEARDFIDKLIEPNLNMRMSAAQALKHPWILKHNKPTDLKAKSKQIAVNILELL